MDDPHAWETRLIDHLGNIDAIRRKHGMPLLGQGGGGVVGHARIGASRSHRRARGE